ncbi:hypothetical protein V7T00_03010 [Segatella copri]|uniref:hypothetical protein n=1 Tax=Segatella copri TaxID=165179 RepID=UPI002FF40C1C
MSGDKIIICPGAYYNEHVEQQNIFGVVNVYPPKDGERGGQTVSSVQLIDSSEDEDLEAEDVAEADFEAAADFKADAAADFEADADFKADAAADFKNAADFKAAAGEDERKVEKDAAAGNSRKETGWGRKSEYLFALDENFYIKDEVKTRKQAELFRTFLKQNGLAELPTSASRNSPLNIAIFSFLKHWKEYGVIPRKRMVGVNTIFRFLTDDCQIGIDTIGKTFNNVFNKNLPNEDSDMEKLVDAFFEENMCRMKD